MRKRLQDLVRGVLATSVGLLGNAATAHASSLAPPALLPPVDEPPSPGVRANVEAGVVIRAARPRVLLRPLSPTSFSVVSSHRSHRSHSSHYSSSGGGSSRPPVTRPTAPVAVAKEPSSGASELGSRVLSRGMKGRDVEELILLLLRNEVLAVDKIPKDSTFTSHVEDAVKSFQQSKKIPVDGRVDYRTLLLLKVK